MTYRLLWFIGVALAVWIIYDVWAKQKEMKESHKVLWSGVAFIVSGFTVASGVAALAYFYGVHNKKAKPIAKARSVRKKSTKKASKKKTSKKKTTKKKSSKKK